jgi:hypothetical protein
MLNKLTFLRTSTSPSIVLITFGTGSSSLMVFSGETAGVWTSFSELFTGKACTFVTYWETAIQGKNVFHTYVFLFLMGSKTYVSTIFQIYTATSIF